MEKKSVSEILDTLAASEVPYEDFRRGCEVLEAKSCINEVQKWVQEKIEIGIFSDAHKSVILLLFPSFNLDQDMLPLAA